MRAKVKFRLLFLMLAIISVTLGVHWTPDTLAQDVDKLRLAIIATVYFALIPLAYWYCIIKIGEQKLWKLLVIFSLSSLVARLSFPADIAHYFEFIAWLRYPIIGVLIIIEMYLIVSIVRGLLKVRNVNGDPRVGVLELYGDDEKKLSVGFILASEATNWYYAIPRFSRNHPPAISSINLLSAKPWHLCLMLTACLLACVSCYVLLVNWSELAAIIVPSIISLSLVMLVANHRLSKHYSLYILRNKLIINNAMWGFMAIELNNIDSVSASLKPKHIAEGELMVGRGKHTNISIHFKKPQWYFGGLGQLADKIETLHLSVKDPEKLRQALQGKNIEQAA
jgi:hypothetical protein